MTGYHKTPTEELALELARLIGLERQLGDDIHYYYMNNSEQNLREAKAERAEIQAYIAELREEILERSWKTSFFLHFLCKRLQAERLNFELSDYSKKMRRNVNVYIEKDVKKM